MRRCGIVIMKFLDQNMLRARTHNTVPQVAQRRGMYEKAQHSAMIARLFQCLKNDWTIESNETRAQITCSKDT